MPTPICSINRVARRLNLSVRTIRTYEAEGFITIERISGRCFLRPQEIELVALISRLRKDLGVNLAGVGAILEMRQRIMELQEEIDRLTEELKG